MVHKKDASVVLLALLVALAAAPRSAAALVAPSVLGQSASAPVLPVPNAVPSGTTVRVDGSDSMAVMNRSLKQGFEQQYAGTTVELKSGGTEAALPLLLAGDVDLVAVDRALTAQERAQGLTEAILSCEKIALIVGADNPFSKSLTDAQVARIFRGEITNWSQVGGANVPIRFVDRPDSSDTRLALSHYPVFKAAPFATGETATQLDQDSTTAVVEQLGSDGIGYALLSQVSDLPNVRIIPLHNTLPTDSRYPFSQSRGYVYKQSASPEVAAFLEFATSPTGQAAIESGRTVEAAASSSTKAATSMTVAVSSSIAPASPSEIASATLVTAASPNTTALANEPDAEATGRPGWLLLLPLALLGGLSWWLLRRRNTQAPDEQGDRPAVSPPQSISPSARPPVTPVNPADDARPSVAARTESIVASDRAARSTSPGSPDSPSAATPPEPPAAEPFNPIGAAGIAGGAMFGAGAIADAMHSADDDAELSSDPIVDDVSADQMAAGEAAADDLTAENFNIEAAIVPEVDGLIDLLPDETAAKNFAQADDPWAAIAPPGTADDVTSEPAIAPPIGESGQLMREPAIADDPLTPPAVPLAVEPIDSVSDAVAEPDLTSNEAAMLDAIEDEVADLSPIENATSAAEPSADLSEQVILAGGAALAAGGLTMMGDAFGARSDREQTTVEAAKFDLGSAVDDAVDLATVDEGLSDLPDGYGESRIVLLPRDPQWAYVYWDVPIEHKAELRRQGGSRLALRLYDVTDLDLMTQRPHSLQQYECDELARDWYLAIPVSDRDYHAEIGYVTEDGRWLMLARSVPMRVPPVYPSDWFEDQFLTIEWEEDLRGKTFLELIPPEKKAAIAGTDNPLYQQIFGMAESTEAQRVAGSLYGSMQQVPQQAISSFVFPSGVGMWAAPFALPLTPSGIGMSGIGVSGVGFSASMPPIRPRQFWLVADAELIVYGATEPDATVTIGGRPIKLNPDGTFRFQMSFQDGLIDYPIMAVAADGEQTRSIHLSFTRETPERNTNTKDEAIDEWP